MQIAMSNATNPRQDKTYAMMRRRFIAVPFCLALLAPVTAAMITASVRAMPAVASKMEVRVSPRKSEDTTASSV